MVPLGESFYDCFVALHDVETRSEDKSYWVTARSNLQTCFPLHGEPNEFPEEVRAELAHLYEHLSIEEGVELDHWMRHEFLLEVVIIADGPVTEALVFVITLLLDKVKTDLHLYLIVEHYLVFVIDIYNLPAGVVGRDPRREYGGVLHFYQKGFSRIRDS